MKIATKRSKIKRHYKRFKYDYQFSFAVFLFGVFLILISINPLFGGNFNDMKFVIFFGILFLIGIGCLGYSLLKFVELFQRGLK